PGLADLDEEIARCEADLPAGPETPMDMDRRSVLLQQREELKQRRDRLLEEYLRDRSRRAGSALPAMPELGDLQRVLPAQTLYLAPVLAGSDLFLLAADRDNRRLTRSPAGPVLEETLARWRGCLAGQLARYQKGLPLGRHERAELDGRLEELSRS